jgi:hypothetical protein
MFYTLLYHGHSRINPKEFAIFLAVMIPVAIIASIFTRKAIVRRKLNNAPLRRLADFKHGEIAKIVGNVEFVDEPLEAPLSGRECAWYYVHVQKLGVKSYNTIIKEERKCTFVLRDGDKVAYINDENIKSYIVTDKEYSSGTYVDATQRLEAYLKKHGHKSQGFLGLNKTIRYNEGVLERYEAVAVLGKGEWRDAELLGLPSEYGTVLVITKPADKPINLTDDHYAVTTHREV